MSKTAKTAKQSNSIQVYRDHLRHETVFITAGGKYVIRDEDARKFNLPTGEVDNPSIYLKMIMEEFDHVEDDETVQ